MDFGLRMTQGYQLVNHKILVTSPEAKFLFPFLGLFGALVFGLGLGLGLVNFLILTRLSFVFVRNNRMEWR